MHQQSCENGQIWRHGKCQTVKKRGSFKFDPMRLVELIKSRYKNKFVTTTSSPSTTTSTTLSTTTSTETSTTTCTTTSITTSTHITTTALLRLRCPVMPRPPQSNGTWLICQKCERFLFVFSLKIVLISKLNVNKSCLVFLP